jgi:hypothetical protein
LRARTSGGALAFDTRRDVVSRTGRTLDVPELVAAPELVVDHVVRRSAGNLAPAA